MKNTFGGSEREGARVRSSVQVNSHNVDEEVAVPPREVDSNGGVEGRVLTPTGESTGITTR